MDELEQIRQKKIQEMMAGQAQQQQEEAELAQQIGQLESIVKTLFTKEALERYGNLKAAHPEIAVRLLALVGQAIQSGKAAKINDTQLKAMLERIAPKKKEIKITRK
jgi:programmed cell death protein 5